MNESLQRARISFLPDRFVKKGRNVRRSSIDSATTRIVCVSVAVNVENTRYNAHFVVDLDVILHAGVGRLSDDVVGVQQERFFFRVNLFQTVVAVAAFGRPRGPGEESLGTVFNRKKKHGHSTKHDLWGRRLVNGERVRRYSRDSCSDGRASGPYDQIQRHDLGFRFE